MWVYDLVSKSQLGTHKLGCINSMAVGVQTPRMSLSSSLVKPAPLPGQDQTVNSYSN